MKLIGPFTQILTLEGMPERGGITDDRLRIIPNGGLVSQDGFIVKTADYDELRSDFPDFAIEEITGDKVLLPGFIDCHTHICWSGSRAVDFAMRNAGKTYLEIAETGGGIWSTVQHTRNAGLEELKKGIRERAKQHLLNGVTTIEVKSGYGLNPESELMMLRAINDVHMEGWTDLIPTCLAAHIKPKDFEGDASAYLKWLLAELLPLVKSEGLSRRIDIFIEKSAFTIDESWPYLDAAKDMGFDLTVHADQFTAGGSILAVRCGAVSADHLEASTESEIKMLADSDTVAVALPGASIGLGEPFTPARSLLDRGAIVAIASDWNPGSAPMGNLLTEASILATYQKLSTAEVFAGLTTRAARALRINDVGQIAPGFKTDLQAYPCSDYREILYNQGQMKPDMIWKRGVLNTPV